MKLEIKHILPYLNSPLYGYFKGVYDIVTEVDFENKIISSMNNGSVIISDFEPILRPLSDLTKEIEMPFGKIVPMEWMFKKDWAEWDGESDANTTMIHTYKCINGKVFPKFLPQYVFEMLLEMHFDLFDLIPNNLAIDKNQIKTIEP